MLTFTSLCEIMNINFSKLQQKKTIEIFVQGKVEFCRFFCLCLCDL